MLLALNAPAADFNALVFSKTLMFRHASITNGIAAIKQLGAENRFHVDATEDANWFTATNLAKYKVVIFLSTSGDILNEAQQAAFKHFIERGGGLVAIHASKGMTLEDRSRTSGESRPAACRTICTLARTVIQG